MTLLRRHGDGFPFHVPVPVPAFADVLEKIGMERHYLSHRSKVSAPISTDPLCLGIIQSLLSYLLRFDLRKIGAFEARCFSCCLAVGSSWGSSWQMQTFWQLFSSCSARQIVMFSYMEVSCRGAFCVRVSGTVDESRTSNLLAAMWTPSLGRHSYRIEPKLRPRAYLECKDLLQNNGIVMYMLEYSYCCDLSSSIVRS